MKHFLFAAAIALVALPAQAQRTTAPTDVDPGWQPPTHFPVRSVPFDDSDTGRSGPQAYKPALVHVDVDDSDDAAPFESASFAAPVEVSSLDYGRDGAAPVQREAAPADAPTVLLDGRDGSAPALTATRSSLPAGMTDNGRGHLEPIEGAVASQLAPAEAQAQAEAVTVGFTSYPNPFSGQTSIEFQASSADHAVVRVYDTSGRLVATPFEGHVEADQTVRATFDASGLAAGTYVCQVTLGAQRWTRSLVVVR